MSTPFPKKKNSFNPLQQQNKKNPNPWIFPHSLCQEEHNVGAKTEPTVPWNHSLLPAFVLEIPPWPHIPTAINGEDAVNHKQIFYATFLFFFPCGCL